MTKFIKYLTEARFNRLELGALIVPWIAIATGHYILAAAWLFGMVLIEARK